MAILKLVAIVWLFLIVVVVFFYFVGGIIETKLNESHPIKKWWRKHIVAPDPYDNDWKNIEP